MKLLRPCALLLLARLAAAVLIFGGCGKPAPAALPPLASAAISAELPGVAATAQIAAKEAEKLAAIAAAEKARDDVIAAHTAAKAAEIATLKARIAALEEAAAAKL